MNFKVTDGNTPLQNVVLYVTDKDGTSHDSITDADGIAGFYFEDGTYTYEASLYEYNNSSGDVTISGADKNIDIVMECYVLNGTFSMVFTQNSDESGFGLVYYQNKYYSSYSNKITWYNFNGTESGIFADYSIEFNCGSEVYNNMLYAMGHNSNSEAPECNIAVYDLASGNLSYQVNIQNALNTFKTAQGITDNLATAGMTYHKDSWYMSTCLENDQDENYIIKFKFDNNFSSIEILDSCSIDFEDNGYSVAGLTSDDTNLWLIVNGYICKLDDSCNLLSRYRINEGIIPSGLDYDPGSSELIIHSIGETVYRWSPDQE